MDNDDTLTGQIDWSLQNVTNTSPNQQAAVQWNPAPGTWTQTTGIYPNTLGTLGGQYYPNAVQAPPTPYTYVPPEEFQQQVVELLRLLNEYGPKLRLLADVLGAMNIEEEDKKNG